eukprot:TRINITY_DN13268_c0_g1_i1.p1 TRINITY_DN13268_c0_g1~~TRINITY_DN13268_c0_g1_i1.p1  ORF type:complete len:771 (-),score=101.70 TRINITY_DN13268_c0_g1_i1:125-2437(-)
MTLHTFSVRSINNQCSLHIHGVQTVNPTDITSVKQSRHFSHLPCKFPLSSLVFGDCLIQLLVKPKGKPTRSPIVLATVRGNDESEKRGRKPYNHDDLLNSIFRASENDHNSEDSDVEFVESIHDSETTDECILPSPKREVVEHPLNNQVNLLDRLKAVHLHLLALEQWNASRLKICHSAYLASAKNLIHFVALQSLDVHQLKEDLSSIGLLNLETVNSYVLASIIAGIQMLENLSLNSVSSRGNPDSMAIKVDNSEEFTISTMKKKASLHMESLFGSLQDGRTAHIMVTVGKESTHSETLISDLLKAGANVIRINCAHDDPGVWSEIIRRVKNSSQMLEKPCRILMDLAGPKLRTGQLKAGPNVMKISPKKDAKGSVILPAQVWLSYAGSGPPPAHFSPDAILFLDDQNFLRKLEVDGVLRFSDVRGRKRTLKIAKKFPVFAGFGFIAECSETAYVGSGTELCMKGKKSRFGLGRVVNVPAVEQFIRLRVGDLLIISRDPCLSPDNSDRSTSDSPRITCSSGRLFDSVKPGDPIAFDDGRIWGVIQGASISEIIVSITHASLNGSKLGSEKSINIPRSDIQFEGLTSKDLVDLEFVATNADMVGVSFIRDPRDIIIVQKELEKRKLRRVGIILKIETQSGFEKLPLLLLQAMKSQNPLGVMIARGDLAVECGWERMADIQEEILSMCNAAHVPVIWATQVLESLVKSGLPTRAEITDVANGRRASCIMLNKGKYVVEAISTLDSMLRNGSTKRSPMADLKPLVLSSHLSL